MQEVKYTFYLNTDDVEAAHHYLERIQRQLLQQDDVVGLREDIRAIPATEFKELTADGTVQELVNGSFPCEEV